MDVLANFEMALSWPELIKRTARDSMNDDAQGLASQLAYYFLLALFPALLCFLAIASFFPLQNSTNDVLRVLSPFAPPEILTIVREQMEKIAEGHHGGLLTIGILGALWSSSSAMVAVTHAMNCAYDIEESRPWWKVRLTAITLTVVLSLFVAFAFGLIVAGPQAADALAAHFSFGNVFVWSWKILQWPIAFGLVMVGIGLIYYFAPDAEQSWVWITPGTLVATLLWLLGSLLFRYYTTSVTNYVATYGAIGGVIVLMLWFYLSGLSIVIGAEMNAEIEHASPWGKAPGERVAGRRKQIGLAAARTYRERAASAPERPAPVSTAAIMPDLAHTPATPFEKAVAPIALFIWRSRTKE